VSRSKMRRNDRQLPAGEAEEILRSGRYGVLSVVCDDGYPYGVPLSYAYDNGKLYFHHTAEESLLADSIHGKTKACFTVVGDTELLPAKFSTKYESVIVFGTISESDDKIGVLMQLVDKLSPDHIEKGRKYAENAAPRVAAYEFRIEQITGKARKTS